ncbi:MAG: hypothetical protein MHM6MM_005946 [Cercozoa sp. M6MM]
MFPLTHDQAVWGRVAQAGYRPADKQQQQQQQQQRQVEVAPVLARRHGTDDEQATRQPPASNGSSSGGGLFSRLFSRTHTNNSNNSSSSFDESQHRALNSGNNTVDPFGNSISNDGAVPEKDDPKGCGACGKKFTTIMLRAHRCKVCLNLFCKSCSSKRLDFGERGLVRVCDHCYDMQHQRYREEAHQLMNPTKGSNSRQEQQLVASPSREIETTPAAGIALGEHQSAHSHMTNSQSNLVSMPQPHLASCPDAGVSPLREDASRPESVFGHDVLNFASDERASDKDEGSCDGRWRASFSIGESSPLYADSTLHETPTCACLTSLMNSNTAAEVGVGGAPTLPFDSVDDESMMSQCSRVSETVSRDSGTRGQSRGLKLETVFSCTDPAVAVRLEVPSRARLSHVAAGSIVPVIAQVWMLTQELDGSDRMARYGSLLPVHIDVLPRGRCVIEDMRGDVVDELRKSSMRLAGSLCWRYADDTGTDPGDTDGVTEDVTDGLIEGLPSDSDGEEHTVATATAVRLASLCAALRSERGRMQQRVANEQQLHRRKQREFQQLQQRVVAVKSLLQRFKSDASVRRVRSASSAQTVLETPLGEEPHTPVDLPPVRTDTGDLHHQQQQLQQQQQQSQSAVGGMSLYFTTGEESDISNAAQAEQRLAQLRSARSQVWSQLCQIAKRLEVKRVKSLKLQALFLQLTRLRHSLPPSFTSEQALLCAVCPLCEKSTLLMLQGLFDP